MGEFGARISVLFDDEYIDKLKEQNITITDSTQKGKNVATTALNDIAKQKKIIATSGSAVTIALAHGEIAGIEKESVDKIKIINTVGRGAVQHALELLNDYNSVYEKELDFCLDKIGIYWTSYCTSYRKKNGSPGNMDRPNKNMLINICDIQNKAEKFRIEAYENIIG
jgi:hypothetical protein